MKFLKISLLLLATFSFRAISNDLCTTSFRIIDRSSFTISPEGVVDFSASEEVSEPGASAVPLITRSLLLPASADLSSLNVLMNSSDVRIVQKNCKVEEAVLFSTDESGEIVQISEEREHPALFPQSHLYNYSVGKLDCYKIITVSLSPYQFNRLTGNLFHADTFTISVSYNQTTQRRSVSPPRSETAKKAEMLTENFSSLQSSYGAVHRSGDAGHYAILTSSSLLPQITSLESFIASKEAQGFTVSIFTEDTWNGTAENGDVHQVRQWLKENYLALGLTHLFIIDNPVTGAVPMLKSSPDWSGRYEPLIDMYYGELSGNWDIDENGTYGTYGAFASKDFTPGGVDRFMELAVGRLPFYGDIEITNAILDRIVSYSAVKSTDAEWRKHLYMPMSDFGPGFGDGAQYGSVITSNVIDKSEWEQTTLFGRECSIEKVTSLWNEANAGLVVWQAHGLQDYAENLMFSSDAADLTVPTHTYQTSCHTGKPEYPENLAFSILKSSAISTIGAAVQCLYTANKTTYGEKGGARDYGYIYAKHMILDKEAAGVSLLGARADLAIKSSTDWLNCIETNLYGCPAVGVSTADIEIDADEVSVTAGKEKWSITIQQSSTGITLADPNGTITGGSITIYSLSGREIDRTVILPGKSMYSVTGNALAQGMYLAEISVTTTAGTEKSTVRFTQMK